MELSFTELLRRLTTDVTTLVRLEIRLALTEVAAKGRGAAASAAGFAAAALFGLGAFAALTVALIAALAQPFPLWLAALMVAVLYAALATIAVQRARSSLEGSGAPPLGRTLQSVGEDVSAMRAALRRGP